MDRESENSKLKKRKEKKIVNSEFQGTWATKISGKHETWRMDEPES